MNAIATEAVSTARLALSRALRSGKPTTEVRRQLSAAEQAEAREQEANQRILAQVEADRAATIAGQVEAETRALREEVLAECAALLPGFTPEVTVESHRLVLLLEARARAAEVECERAALAADIETLSARLADVQGQLDALRAQPERTEADLGKTHFLLLDQADIEQLIAAAQAQLEALVLPDLAGLERDWAHARVVARFKARAQVMAELERRLLAMAAEARAVLGPGREPTLRYRPSAEMRQAAQNTIV